MSLECEHGQLARACNICEYEREIAELKARVGELEAERDKLRIEASHDLAIARDEWKRIALEAQEKIEDLFQDMREIGVAE